MKTYTVVAIEKFLVRTTYTGVKARDKKDAEARCLEGKEGYEEKEILEGDEEWIETESVEEE